MTPNGRSRARLSILALSLALGGCISLLPKEQPVQLYRLNLPASAAGAGDAGLGKFRGSRRGREL